jgi:hypothetical protein
MRRCKAAAGRENRPFLALALGSPLRRFALLTVYRRAAPGLDQTQGRRRRTRIAFETRSAGFSPLEITELPARGYVLSTSTPRPNLAPGDNPAAHCAFSHPEPISPDVVFE